ncbi:WS/DGAT/MGAT family O-acyltransferase [Candidatus Mycolicibacterium alkanivorans]|uniref:Diacylglycerol O-acyltransferase n=1 Tax=Candidatus Mycolicibacterium alkanivorans TaxID=2954114 RepID=A0ABS9YSR1_9MYCO|nr:wax ester/triacylglycerol synthase family O-acyltransferase [Candidatus Mycolicibacterium alkanivorans]MCI4674263.1 wax ester/triacylglycerol synthase family O-acyltransferase [Candidatus Mycolicibacterium alkanivorans]
MRRPQRLSGLDASFLYLETANQPVQVFMVIELDASTIPGGYSYDRLREALAARIQGIPAFREKLSDTFFNLDHPAWAQDSNFDIDRHVHRVGLRAPGGPAELAEICGVLAGLPLDRRAPLWEMWVIEGADGSLDGDRLRVLLKVHHAAADGVTFGDFLSLLCTAEPDPPPTALVQAAAAVGPVAMAVDGLARFVRRPVLLVTRVVPATVSAVVDIVRRTRAGRAMAAPFSAPRTRLNGVISARRNVAFAQLDLDDVKKVKNHFGVTVNDVIMALVSGVIRQFLLERGELPNSSLVALVPASVHEATDQPSRNQVSGMFARLQTQIADPVERLRAVAEANAIAKEQTSAIGPALLQDWFEILGSVTLGIARRIYGLLTRFRPMYNVIVSNVPGPPLKYFLGAELLAAHPFGPVLFGAGLNITLASINGKLDFGLISCPDLVPDLSEMADGLAAGLTELLGSTAESATPSPTRTATG